MRNLQIQKWLEDKATLNIIEEFSGIIKKWHFCFKQETQNRCRTRFSALCVGGIKSRNVRRNYLPLIHRLFYSVKKCQDDWSGKADDIVSYALFS